MADVKGLKISDRLAAIKNNSEKWDRKYEKPVSTGANLKIGGGLADRLAAIETDAESWKSKNKQADKNVKSALSERLQNLNKSQEVWKGKGPGKVCDHETLNVAFRADRYASPARTNSLKVSVPSHSKFSANVNLTPEDRRGRIKEKPLRPEINVPKIVVSPEEVDLGSELSLLEKIATKKGEDNIQVHITKERTIPTADLDGLDSIISSSAGCRHSVAIGEFDNFSFVEPLPTTGSFLNVRKDRPKRKTNHKGASRNRVKNSKQGRESYTETRTIEEKTSGKQFTKNALAGLAAREDINGVRLRSVSRNRNDEQVPYKHPLLIRFKGRRHVVPSVVEASVTSLNHHDSFLLVTPTEVYLFQPELSNVVEKAKAKDFGNFVCQTSDLGTKARKPKMVRINGTEEFWNILGGKMEPLHDINYDPDEEDDEYEHSHAENNRCWKLSDETPPALVPEMSGWAKQPSQVGLNSEAIYIFEFGNEVYIWLGKEVPFPMRRIAQALAKELWSKYPRDKDAFLGRITQHRETALFTEKFEDWIRPNQENILTPMAHRTDKGKGLVEYKVVSADLSKDNSKPTIMSGKYNISGGDGNIVDKDGRIMEISTVEYQIKQVKKGKFVDSPGLKILKEDEVVIVVWLYCISGTGRWEGKEMKKVRQFDNPKGATREIVFLWGGPKSHELELGEAALLATDLKLGVIHNVAYGNEPEAFTKAWKGKLRIHSSINNNRPSLFVIQGHSETGGYLLEVNSNKRSLRKRNGFILIDDEKKKFAVNSVKEVTEEIHHIIAQNFERQLSRQYRGGFTSDPTHESWFDANVKGSDFVSASSEKIEKLFRIEKSQSNLIPVQLPSRRIGQSLPFDQIQLENVSILLTSRRIILWNDSISREGSNKKDFENVIKGATEIAERMSKDVFDLKIEFVCCGTEDLRFQRLFPTWLPKSIEI